jgi:hypothetical protein
MSEARNAAAVTLVHADSRSIVFHPTKRVDFGKTNSASLDNAGKHNVVRFASVAAPLTSTVRGLDGQLMNRLGAVQNSSADETDSQVDAAFEQFGRLPTGRAGLSIRTRLSSVW